MKNNISMGKNAILNSIRAICNILFPIITVPYVSRVLHVNNIGIYNYCYSIVNYFSLLAGLGISTYAVREGARLRNNKNNFSKFASNILSLNLLSTFISYVLLILLVRLLHHLSNYSLIILILSISILMTTIGCDWIFTIYENYTYITIRSIFIQILSLFLLFWMVRDEHDLINYCLVSVFSNSANNILNWFSVKKYCRIRINFSKELTKYLKPIFILFFNNIAITVFVNSDITMLGILSNNYYTGLYSTSSKIYTIVKNVLSAVIVVSMPRLSYYLSINQYNKYKIALDKICSTIITVTVPSILGIFFLSDNIIYIIGGSEYSEAASSLRILSIALFFSMFSWIYSNCVLIANRKDKEILFATSVAALINVVLNVILIPKYNQNAAALTTVISELVSMTICMIKSKKIYIYKINLKNSADIIIGSSMIIVICIMCHIYISDHIISLLIAVFGSVLTYFIVLKIRNNETLTYFINDILIKK